MKKYITIFILLLVTEIAIAYFQFHSFIRGFIGDVLVIPLLYSLAQSIKRFNPIKVTAAVVLFAFAVEIAQYFSIAEILNIQNRFVKIIIGSHFDPWDLLAYTLGILPIIFIENFISYGKD